MLSIKSVWWYPFLGMSRLAQAVNGQKTADDRNDRYVDGDERCKLTSLGNNGPTNSLFKAKKDLKVKTCRECYYVPGMRWNKKTKRFEEYERRVCRPVPCD